MPPDRKIRFVESGQIGIRLTDGFTPTKAGASLLEALGFETGTVLHGDMTMEEYPGGIIDLGYSADGVWESDPETSDATDLVTTS